MWFIGVEVEQETSAPPPKKNPGSAHANGKRHVPVLPNENSQPKFPKFFINGKQPKYVTRLSSVKTVCHKRQT